MDDRRARLGKALDEVVERSRLDAILGEIDPMKLTAREIGRAVRAAERLGIAIDARVAFLGAHTFEPLPAYLKAHGLCVRLGIATYVGPYGQYMQELLTEESGLRRFAPDVLLLSCAVRQLAPRLYQDFSSFSAKQLAVERQHLLDHVIAAAEAAAAATPAIVLVANFPRPAYPAVGVADSKQPLGEAEFYLELNLELIRRLKGAQRIYVFDLDRLAGGFRANSAERMFFLAKSIWHESQCSPIAQELLRYVVAAAGRTRKCLVVDLDNTVWGGVVGEDGATGVKVGQGSPIGEAFESHQQAIRSLANRGTMLAVCSKNNQEDVTEAFDLRPEMPLKWSDFVAAEISWADKASGLRQLAADLNIGEDSMVLLDDNPAERAIVRGELPGVMVPELPPDPADYATFLRQQVLFEKLRINEDDLVRLSDYKAGRSRNRLKAEARSLDQYLSSLETRVVVRPAQRKDLARIHELFNKTNQFNLTTRRYSTADVERFLREPRFSLTVVSAEDRFGKMGIIGTYLLEVGDELARLDSLLLSCRALGRGIGTTVMNCLKIEVEREMACKMISAEFVPTKKNAPARGFLGRQGFDLQHKDEDGREEYVLSGRGFLPLPCEFVSVTRMPGGKGRAA